MYVSVNCFGEAVTVEVTDESKLLSYVSPVEANKVGLCSNGDRVD